MTKQRLDSLLRRTESQTVLKSVRENERLNHELNR